MEEFFPDGDQVNVNDHLKKAVEETMKSANQLPSHVFVIQSSGSGKTFHCIRLLSQMKGLFIMRDRAAGYKSSAESNDFLSAMTQYPETIADTENGILQYRNAVAIAFVRMLEKAILGLNQRELYESQSKGRNILAYRIFYAKPMWNPSAQPFWASCSTMPKKDHQILINEWGTPTTV